MKILFLHLSDLHLSRPEDVAVQAVKGIAACLSPQSIGSVDRIIVLVTGDIAHSGKKMEYDSFFIFRRLLISELRATVLDNTLIYVYIVPGNHDIDYSYISNSDNRKYYEDFLKNQTKATSFNIDEAELKARQAFFQCSRIMHSLDARNSLFRRNVIDLDGFTIEINLLNTTFFSLLHENDQGLHFLPNRIIEQLASPSGAMMAITLLHHSHQWFNELCKRSFEQVLLEKNTIIFCGHEHFSSTQEIAYNEGSPVRIFGGGSLCNRGDWSTSEFFACIYDTDAKEFEQHRFQWDNYHYFYTDKLESRGYLAHKYSVDGPKQHNATHITSLLEDQHIHISNRLSDYYVFPGLSREIAEDEKKLTEVFELNRFYQKVEEEKRLEITGADSSGKSALLKMLFQHYLPQRYVLFCKVDDIVSGNRRRIIKGLFEYIYSSDENEYSKFVRSNKENKMILIDDIHLIKSKHLSSFLEGIEEEFGYIIYTTNNLLKLDIQERIKTAIAADSYSCYRILPLYRAKRKMLVEKIIPLKYPDYSIAEKENLVNRICHVLDLQRRYIPLTPEVILQFLEHYANYQMESAQNDGNIFGKVFESSLTNILSPFMSGTLTVDKAMLVLGKIAFYIHSNKRYPITGKEIIDIIEVYCAEYGAKMNSIDFISTIVRARILTKYGEDGLYKFCNNNYLAYFVASEICASRDSDAVQHCLNYACFGINSTILMFVTYLTNETTLIDRILNASLAVTTTWEEFRFGMPGFKHLEVQTPIKKPYLPSQSEKEYNIEIDDKTDRSEIENAHIDVISIYDYDEGEISKLENQLIRAISLLMLVARSLPNFEHRLKKEQKESIVQAIYTLPNQIFYAWAKETERCSESLVHLILSMETNEFTRRIRTEDDAKRLLQWNSISLLLEFYYGTINSAYRENTYDYLTEMAGSVVNFTSETHRLERLILLGQSKRIDEFCTEGTALIKSTKSPAAKLALSCIVHQLLIKEVPSGSQIKRLESLFSMERAHTANLYRRHIKKKEK